MVAAKKKSGAVRICIDPRDLNKAIKRPHHPMKTIEEVIGDIPNAKFFSTLDAKAGFWQIPLSEDSIDYTTFNTAFGRYQFERLPFGLSSSSEVFQQTMEQLFAGYPCHIIVDDILVTGPTLEKHDENLRQVLTRCREVGLQLNKEKCKFRMKEVSYVGHMLTHQGVSPDQSKVKAITDMPPPEDKAALQRFLGMINYLSKFIPNYSDKTEVLRSLLKKDTEWCWLEQHDNAFGVLKEALISPPLLQYYDVNKPIVVTCDSSKAGLGTALLQEERPVAYASRALTECEQNYAQIEKELLAVTFACKKFHDYIYGKDVLVETDHQPLINIYKKPLSSAPKRLQRMLLQLQRYNIKLMYKAGKELYIADTLSRAYLPGHDEEVDEEEFEVLEYMNISSERAEQVKTAAEESEEYTLLKNYILEGWPEKGSDVHSSVRSYFAFRDELILEDDVIMKSHRVFIPVSLRSVYLELLHKGHPGVETTKQRARETVFWIGIEKDIEKMVARCEPCNIHAPSQQKEPMISSEAPTLPYQIVAADLFEWRNQDYLVTVDSYSGFYDIDKLSDKTSKTTIKKLRKQFATHGTPMTLYTDNGTQFTSHEFKKFAKEWKFDHVTSSPHYPQSNGLAERAVRSAKSLMNKCAEDNSDIYLALLLIRNTPRHNLGSSAERLYSRKLRTVLTMSEKSLEPVVQKNVAENLKKVRAQKKKYYDKTAKPLPALREKDTVRVQEGKRFEKKGEIVKEANRPRSYIVNVDGKLYERNRRHLRKVEEPYVTMNDDDAPPPPPPDEYELHERDESDDEQDPLDEEAEQDNDIQQQQQNERLLEAPRTSRYGRVYKENTRYKDCIRF